METETFIPLDYDLIDEDNSNIIRIWGKTSSGKRICVLDNLESYFWLIPQEKLDLNKYSKKIKDIEVKHAGREAKVLDVQLKEKSFLGKEVKALKIIISNYKDASAIKEIIKSFPEEVDRKECEFNPVTRYIIDKKVFPLEGYKVTGEELNKKELKEKGWNWKVDYVIRAKEITSSDFEISPRILAFDIETSEFEVGKGEILMISAANKNVKKVFTCKKFSDAPEEIEFVKNEEEVIRKFIEFIEVQKPDFLVGYFSDAFDLPYLRMRADKYKIKTSLGLDNSSIKFIHGAIPSSEIRGLVHIDLYKFVNNILSYSVQSETISLNDIAREFIGEEKLEIDLGKITKEIKNARGKIEEIELKKFALYNLQDSVLASKLFEKLWTNISELTKLVKEPLYDVSRATYSSLVESNILHNLHRFNEIAESRPSYDEIQERKNRPKYTGAFVKEPTPGIYDSIGVFDFRSFYPNVIVSFNISMPTINSEKSGSFETPDFEFEKKKRKFYFSKERGFIPQILGELLEKRKEVKKELKSKRSNVLEARDYALKTLSNATYGYYGFAGARYYSLECAASITAIARYYIHKTIEDIEKKGFKVIYSDTDSVMFSLGKKTKEDALKMLDEINDSLPGTMEMDLENFYLRGIFVMKRTGELGAKKKYALLSKPKGDIKIRGFESVRRDRCKLAKDTQDEILRRVLEEGNPDSAIKYAVKIIKELKDKKVPIEKLVIRTQMKKEIGSYESIGPHVTVARRMLELGLPIGEGSLIEFVIAKGNEKLIRERSRIPDEVKEGDYDIEYYINHQVIPAIESIFGVFNISSDELRGKTQKSLKEF